jgi:hypothetical protein
MSADEWFGLVLIAASLWALASWLLALALGGWS